MTALRLFLATLFLLGACSRQAPSPPPRPHYVVGSGYQSGGTWYYPAENFSYDATGLAEILPDRVGLTADGERADPTALAGAHQTLQLPAIARVTNLETGLQILVRINDRGPAKPSRLLGLTPHAATMLGMAPGTPARIRIQLDSERSQALRDQLQAGAGAPTVAAAPRSAVAAESLAPPPGIAQSSRGQNAPGATLASAAAGPQGESPEILPDQAQRVPAEPGQLWLRAGQFSQAAYANRRSAQLADLGAGVERLRTGRSETFRVRAGPFATIPQADAALDQALSAGVTDARIVVE